MRFPHPRPHGTQGAGKHFRCGPVHLPDHRGHRRRGQASLRCRISCTGLSMSISFSPQISAVHFPPISEVKGWLAIRPETGLELIDLCQAVPDYPPAPELTAHLATLLDDPLTSKYSPDEGLPEV